MGKMDRCQYKSYKNPRFLIGYSASHFSGGQWNSGGQCDSETKPIKNEAYLSQYPPIMSMLERVMKGMETPVTPVDLQKAKLDRGGEEVAIEIPRLQPLVSPWCP